MGQKEFQCLVVGGLGAAGTGIILASRPAHRDKTAMNGAQLLKAYGDSSGLMSGPPAPRILAGLEVMFLAQREFRRSVCAAIRSFRWCCRRQSPWYLRRLFAGFVLCQRPKSVAARQR